MKTNLSNTYKQWIENKCQETEDRFATDLIHFVEGSVRQIQRRRHALQYADDAIGVALVEVWKSLENYDDKKGLFTTWATGVIKNTLADAAKERMERNELKLFNNIATDGGIMNLENKILLKKLIDTLEPEDQELVRLHFEGYTEEEAGEKLGKNRAYINNRWMRVIMPALQKAAGTGG